MLEITLPEPAIRSATTSTRQTSSGCRGERGTDAALRVMLPGTALEVSTALTVRVRQVSTIDKEIHAPGTKAYNRNRVVPSPSSRGMQCSSS
jgi:hypothetical protein